MLRPGSLEGERRGNRARLRLVQSVKDERDLRMAAGLNTRATAEQRNKQPVQNDAPPNQEILAKDDEVTG